MYCQATIYHRTNKITSPIIPILCLPSKYSKRLLSSSMITAPHCQPQASCFYENTINSQPDKSELSSLVIWPLWLNTTKGAFPAFSSVSHSNTLARLQTPQQHTQITRLNLPFVLITRLCDALPIFTFSLPLCCPVCWICHSPHPPHPSLQSQLSTCS